MHRSPWRAGRWPLAVALTSLMTLGACVDDGQPITAPSSHPTRPNLAVGDVITVTNSKGSMDVGSLRWAVAQATGGEIIRFDARLAGTTIVLDTTLVIANSVTVEGPKDKGVTISGGSRGRVIDIAAFSQPPTKLLNLSITGGKLLEGGGAGIRTSSPMVLEHSTVWGNEAPGSPAILGFNYGTLTLTNSTVSGNTSTAAGYPAVTAGNGLTLTSSTVAYNSQGGIYIPTLSWAVLESSIIASNGYTNCLHDENLTYMGKSLSNDMSCGDSTFMVIGDAKLQTLRDNGGPSMTHAVTLESPAFNTGGCRVAVDQRYQARDERCDLGAFESTDRTTVSLTIDRSPNFLSGASARVSGTVKCSRDGDQFNLRVQLEQRGPDKTVVQGSGVWPITCTAMAQSWTALIVPSSGAFKSGNATVTAATQQTPTWVTPATTSRSIKLVEPGI